MKKIEGEVQEIRALILIAQRANYEERSQKFVEILNRIKKLLIEFDHRKKLGLEPLKHVLVVLHKLLGNGSVTITSVENKEVWDWGYEKLGYFLEHWDEL